ncbi:MAG: ADOP family duplicated permease [Longimicrobiales bacterium]
MTWRKPVSERFRALFRKGRMDAEMAEELRFHIEMETEKNVRRGMEPGEARRHAMIAFGGVERFGEQARAERGMGWAESLVQDVRYALRQLRRDPGFALVAILTLALGIGATTTIFSVVNGVLLNPLTFAEPDRLVLVWQERPFSKSMLEEFRGELPFLQGVAAYNHRNFTLVGDGEPEELRGAAVSPDYFAVMGVSAVRGRAFLPGDGVPGQGRVVVLSHRLWERRYGSDPGILGREISLGEGEGVTRTVVGVLPRGHRPLSEQWDLWIPFQVDPSDFSDYAGTASFTLVGRLADGITPEAASRRFHEVAGRLTAEKDFITDEERGVAGVKPLKAALLGDVQLRLLVLLGSVGLVLLLACINVANLLLARGQGRQRELGIRLSAGAARGRVIRQLLTESLVLGMLGGGCGVLLAYWSLPVFVRLVPPGTPRIDLIALDGRVLLFTVGVSVVSALLFGLVPAVRATGRDLQASLKDGGLGRALSPGGQRLRNGLVVVELALAVVVVVGASLLFRSFWLLQHQDPGFDPGHVLTLRLSPSPDRYPDGASRHAFYEDVAERVSAVGGVEGTGWSSGLPLAGGGMAVRYRSDESPHSTDYLPEYAGVRVVSPGFFSALRIPLSSGAYPEGLTGEEEGETVLVNRALALSLWPDGEDPAGKTVWLPFGSETPARIAGAVEDFSQRSLDRATQPEIYIPWEAWSPAPMYLLVRTGGPPEALAPDIQAAVWSLDRAVPISYVRSMEEVVRRTMADSRFTTLLLAVFGGLSLILGGVGVYGVASYAVSQSTFEIGVRLALGAGRAGVVGGVLARFLALSAAGIVVGLLGALAAGQALEGLLYDVSATDPWTFLGVGLFLALVAATSVFLPAFRASRVEPARVLNQE